MTLAANLRGEMARQRRRQVDLAAVLSMSQAAVSRRLSGETPLDVDELYAVASWLDLPITDLMPQPVASGGGKHATCSPPSVILGPAAYAPAA